MPNKLSHSWQEIKRRKVVRVINYYKPNTMKTCIRIALIILGLQLAFARSSSAQKMIRIDASLKSNSQQVRVKRKGVSSVGRYEFGTYKVISSKGGWETTTHKSPLFSDNSSIKSSTRMSFVFINDMADTCITNIQKSENIEVDEGGWFLKTFTNWNEVEVKEGEGIYEAAFSFSNDTALWSMVLIYPIIVEVEGEYQMDDHTYFRGILTDSSTLIEIVEITESEDGKNSMFNPVLGYEFWQDSKSLAAVQLMPMNKWYVWIRNDLDADLKFVLASAATAMLVKGY